MKSDRRIQEIQKLSNVQSEEGRIKESVLTYRKLQFLYPQEKEFYVTYIQYLEEESVIAELLWNAWKYKISKDSPIGTQTTNEINFHFSTHAQYLTRHCQI